MVAHAQWAFRVVQGSVETLFRWGGKRWYHFIANLFRKPCTKFHQNCLSFVGDITRNILVSFFQTHYRNSAENIVNIWVILHTRWLCDMCACCCWQRCCQLTQGSQLQMFILTLMHCLPRTAAQLYIVIEGSLMIYCENNSFWPRLLRCIGQFLLVVATVD